MRTTGNSITFQKKLESARLTLNFAMGSRYLNYNSVLLSTDAAQQLHFSWFSFWSVVMVLGARPASGLCCTPDSAAFKSKLATTKHERLTVIISFLKGKL